MKYFLSSLFYSRKWPYRVSIPRPCVSKTHVIPLHHKTILYIILIFSYFYLILFFFSFFFYFFLFILFYFYYSFLFFSFSFLDILQLCTSTKYSIHVIHKKIIISKKTLLIQKKIKLHSFIHSFMFKWIKYLNSFRVIQFLSIKCFYLIINLI